MQRRVEVMNGMISIIPTVLVVDVVNAIEDTAEMSIRITSVNEGMLRPIAHHHNKTSIDHRHDEDHQRRLEIYKTHDQAKEIKCKFSKTKPKV